MTPQIKSPDGGRGSNLREQAYSNCTANYSTNPADCLLPRLEKVRETAPDQWLACCPAHDDRSPSLSIKRVDDRILLNCFSGCPASDVVAAVGLRLSDLFDKPLTHHGKPLRPAQRRRYGQALDALRALQQESVIVLIAAQRAADGHAIEGDDLARLIQARDRIEIAARLAGGGR